MSTWLNTILSWLNVPSWIDTEFGSIDINVSSKIDILRVDLIRGLLAFIDLSTWFTATWVRNGIVGWFTDCWGGMRRFWIYVVSKTIRNIYVLSLQKCLNLILECFFLMLEIQNHFWFFGLARKTLWLCQDTFLAFAEFSPIVCFNSSTAF